MSTFDHAGLMQDINECLGPFRKSQSEAMRGFAQLGMVFKTDTPMRDGRTNHAT